ncbi:hypothetical protein [Conexibacter sp. SYSU D00693]|uniref:hypothetical protein n=1 Tax=Conexibacter sp. SYSU D00693 TaxID=2812560 RepID=UPI00196A91FD|nr:hypothetical protein [Conexibacter sp. SYSU D00693]
MRGSRAAVVAAVAGVLVALAPAASAQARPRIAGLQVTQTGLGPPGPDYEVEVAARVRVCAQRGRVTVRVREQDTTFETPPTVNATQFRRFTRTQRSRCQTHEVSWILGDRFFGVGVYRLRFQVADRQGALSPSVFRKFETGD